MSTNIFCLRPCDQFKAVTEANFKASMAIGGLKMALERAVEIAIGWAEGDLQDTGCTESRCFRRFLLEMPPPSTCKSKCGVCVDDRDAVTCALCAKANPDKMCDEATRIRCVAEGLFRQAMEPPKIEVAH